MRRERRRAKNADLFPIGFFGQRRVGDNDGVGIIDHIRETFRALEIRTDGSPVTRVVDRPVDIVEMEFLVAEIIFGDNVVERIENIVGILNENSDAIWLQQYCEEKEITFSILVTIYEEYLKKVTNNNI